MKETPLLSTPRLHLRPFTLEDVDAVYLWCSSWEVTRYLFWYPHKDKEVTKRLLTNWLRKKRNYSWALDKDGTAIGEIQVIKDLPNQGFEVGYSLNELYWRKGYMKEALLAVLDYLFTQEGYLYSLEETDARNLASQKLLESVGYHFVEQKDKVFIAKKNETISESVYRLSKEEYLAFSDQMNASVDKLSK